MSYINGIVLKCCLVGRLILYAIMRIKTDRELITRPTRNLRAQSSAEFKQPSFANFCIFPTPCLLFI